MSKLSVSVPTERLERDVRARLSPQQIESIDLFVWDMTDPTPRQRIDIVVPPYMSARDALPRLADVTTRLVQSQSIGWDDVPHHLPAGHVFANAASVHETATAELALALTLAVQRRLPQYVRQQDAHEWRGRFANGLADCRVLLLGYGGVGKATAARLDPFEVEVVPVASSARVEDGREVHAMSELAELLPTTDVLIVTLPDTPDTRGLIDDAVLSALPDGALVVNVGRGPIIDTDALVDHLRRERILAALDVTEPEPLPADHPLWSAPGVLISPHVGGASAAMQPRIAQLVADQITRMLDGEDARNVVYSS